MKYPNSSKSFEKPALISASGRGMSLENDINVSNKFYLSLDKAIIHKKPTPVTIVKVDYPKRSAAKISEAYFKVPSTTDYNGIYKGRYVDFEAKECNSTTSFPFSSIHPHQVEHLDSVIRHGAIAFIIMRLTQFDKTYLIKANDFITFYKNTDRRSLPFAWIFENGHEIQFKYQIPCDYLTVLDKVFEI